MLGQGRRPNQIDFLALAFGLGHDDTLPFGMNAEGLATHLSGQIEGLFGDTVPGQLQGVGRHPRLERPQHLRCRAEEAIVALTSAPKAPAMPAAREEAAS